MSNGGSGGDTRGNTRGQTSPTVRHHKHGIYGDIFLAPNMIQCLQPLDLVSRKIGGTVP